MRHYPSISILIYVVKSRLYIQMNVYYDSMLVFVRLNCHKVHFLIHLFPDRILNGSLLKQNILVKARFIWHLVKSYLHTLLLFLFPQSKWWSSYIINSAVVQQMSFRTLVRAVRSPDSPAHLVLSCRFPSCSVGFFCSFSGNLPSSL